MPQFTTPTRIEKITTDRLFSRYGTPTGITVMRIDGAFREHPYPWASDLARLQEGVDYFLGGREYTVSSAVAEELWLAGFPIAWESALFGQGEFGSGPFGGT